MSAEAYSWKEGIIFAYTGTATASAIVGFAQNLQFTPQWGYDNLSTVGGSYYDRLTGQRADLAIQAVYTNNGILQKMAQSATAVHLKLLHSSLKGTAGYHLYSGRIQSLPLIGVENDVFKFTMQYYTNRWSAF